MLATARSVDTKIRNPKVAIIVQSEVENQPILSYASEEAARIRETIPAQFMLNASNPPAGNSGKVCIQDALDQLKDASIVQIICHGQQDSKNPLDSALFLEDGKLTISDMQSIQRPPAGSLAFLSACMSAKGDEKQPDEVIHLAATMLCVGFQSVVATMW